VNKSFKILSNKEWKEMVKELGSKIQYCEVRKGIYSLTAIFTVNILYFKLEDVNNYLKASLNE
jgi:hypothetical protein